MRHEPNRAAGAARARRQRGVTLVELMITVAIIGIIAAVAYPIYTAQTTKARRSDAKSSILRVLNLQEIYFGDNQTYVVPADVAEWTSKVHWNYGPLSENGYYTLALAQCGARALTSCIQVTATKKAGGLQAGDTDCTAFTANTDGTRTATGSLGNRCWQ